MRARHDLSAGQRWLLACLCLLASLVYLSRVPGPSGVTLSSPFQGRTTQTRSAQAKDGIPERALPISSGMEDMGRADGAENHHESATHSVPDLTSAAPNAPPAGQTHQHAAHCPFCFTSAFALEADGILALPSTSRPPERAVPVPVRLYLAALRHADPRAPPAQG